jgi:hypothetical protein
MPAKVVLSKKGIDQKWIVVQASRLHYEIKMAAPEVPGLIVRRP